MNGLNNIKYDNINGKETTAFIQSNYVDMDTQNEKIIMIISKHKNVQQQLHQVSINNSQDESENEMEIINDNEKNKINEYISQTQILKPKSYGPKIKSNIYETNEKFVQIVFVMIT